MSRKHSQPARGGKPPHTDDLKRIIGIGPAVEARLQSVGIYTFAQLISLSPADIAASVVGVAGSSADRIIKQDWIGQARRLMGKSMEKMQDEADKILVEAEIIESETLLGNEPVAVIEDEVALLETAMPEDGEATMEQSQTATFTVALHFDEHHSVISTRAVNMQNGKEEGWDGWQTGKLVRFFSDQAELHLPEIATAMPAPAPEEAIDHAIEETEATSDEQTILVAPAELEPVLGGAFHLRELELATPGESEQHNLLLSGKPFEASLTLDLAEVKASSAAPLAYTASIYGKRLDSSARSVLGQGQGSIILSDKAAINVQGIAPPQGLYRMGAVVTLTQASGAHVQRPGLAASIEERLLQSR